jgi:ABC-type nitrate/sulfonate/bicarbonate transport system ATPase subunit
LQPIKLAVADNDFITIVGPSGCGKSTLLRIVAGLDTPTVGRVMLDGAPVSGPGADRGMVFQSYTLFPWLTARQNICFGLREKNMPLRQQDEIAAHYIAKGRARRLRAPLPENAIGWNAAAHGDCSGARQ